MMKIKRTIFFIQVFVIFFIGCVEESGTPTETPISTITPEQTVSTSTSTPLPTPEAPWMPIYTLESGYKWYQNDTYGYGFGYPENWVDLKLGLSEGQESGVSFGSEPLSGNTGFPDAMISAIVYSDPEQIKFWEEPSFIEQAGSLEKAKEMGWVLKYGNITINGRTGFEVIYDPMLIGHFSKTPTMTKRTVVFTIDDLYYVIEATSSNKLYDKYKSIYEEVINSFIIKE